MGRYGLGTRIAMIVIGAIWLLFGGWRLCYIIRFGGGFANTIDQLNDTIAVSVAAVGAMLLKTALTPDRPKTFEDEIPDAHPDLSLWDD
jgi:hypothetical protein